MTIRHIVYRCVHDSEKGVPTLASEMGKSYQVLLNKLNVNSESHHLTIDELELIGDFINSNIAFATYFAQKSNAVVVQLPEVEQYGDMNLLDSFMQCVESNGEIARDFKDAYADGRIDDREYQEIKASMYTSIADQIAFLKLIESLTR
ncbi:MAG: phage regulatory CII family protein [Methylophilaceae bacterium]